MSNSRDRDPTLSVSAVNRRCHLLSSKFCEELGRARGSLSVFHEMSDSSALILLGGRASEVIERNVGKRHRVVKLCSISEELHAWIGFREQWQRVDGRRNFTFTASGFTVHVGKSGEMHKPQVMRSEWMGRQCAGFSSDVGQPHWHVDVLETARLEVASRSARFHSNTGGGVSRDFTVDRDAQMYEKLFYGVAIERMHLASAAPWWQKVNTRIAHSPATVSELDRWIFGCISYIRQEMYRCGAV